MPTGRTTVVDASSYRSFFRDQEAKVGQLDQRRLTVAAFVAIALLGLLSFLHSPWPVWIWVVALYAVTFYGFDRLRMALQVTRSALQDLRELAEFLQTPPTRAEIESYVADRISPDDSNVPEALAALFSGQVSGERVRAAANSAFSQPASELSVAQFLRTALVLGGLFGTVLFFAVELGKPGLPAGDLSTLLPGLRGALASTLTGILGSVTLGYVGSKIDQIVERSVWETESLIGGPFSRSLSVIPETVELESEVQLWHALVSEVATLRRETQESYAKLGNDVTAHVAALQALSKQLEEVPPLQVPPQLASLGDSIAIFKAGTDQLQATVGRLVEAVGTVGLSVPTHTLETLRNLRDESAIDRERLQQSLSVVVQAVTPIEGAIGAISDTLSARAEHTDAALSSLRLVQEQHVSKIDDVGQSIDAARALIDSGLRHVSDSVSRLPETLSRIADGRNRTQEHSAGNAAPLPDSLEVALPDEGTKRGNDWDSRGDGGSARLEPPRSQFEDAPQELRRTNEQLSTHVQTMREVSATLEARSAQLARSVDQVAEYQRAILGLESKLEAMQKWHERAVRAPLMRLLLLSFGRGRGEQPSHGA